LTKQLHLRNEPCFPHHKYEPKVDFENDTHKLYWNCDLLTNKTVHFNWPDIILVDRTSKEAALIGIANLLTHSLQATIIEKQSIYQELAFDNRQQWQPNKITVTPFVLAATSGVPRGEFGVFNPPPLEIPKAFQNRAKLNPICENC
jgi:hypothetical protein